MEVGLLWFDDDKNRTIEEKVRLAARRYREKFGMVPDTCYVNQASFKGKSSLKLKGEDVVIKVIAAPNILPHHFWIGVSRRRRKQVSRPMTKSQ
jgi:hypothetical protein